MHTLEGTVTGMRVVEGEVKEGSRAGEVFQFISLEITDTRYGKVYSCQMSQREGQYGDFVQNGKLTKDLANHTARVLISSESAGEREIEEKATGQRRTVLQIRHHLAAIKDMGEVQIDF